MTANNDDMNEIKLRRPGLVSRAINRSNLPGTCLYCGQKLRRNYEAEYKKVVDDKGFHTERTQHHATGTMGAYEDNAFCSLRCGYCFGVLMASFGKRLQPR